jgi:hypothetical protein
MWRHPRNLVICWAVLRCLLGATSGVDAHAAQMSEPATSLLDATNRPRGLGNTTSSMAGQSTTGTQRLRPAVSAQSLTPQAQLAADAARLARAREAARRRLTSRMLSARKTDRLLSLREFVDAASRTSATAPVRYKDFAAYWARANSTGQRSGFVLEAVLASRARPKLAGTGESMLLTAVEGFPTHSADLVQLNDVDLIGTKYQSKLSIDSIRKANPLLSDPRYKEYRLVTTREALASLTTELEQKKLQMLRRGKPLPANYAAVADALDSGRLMKGWFGEPLPSREAVERLARRYTKEQFEEAAAQLRQGVENRGVKRVSGRVGRALFAVGVAGVIYGVGDGAYRTIQDVSRFRRGEIGGDYMAVKSAIRGTQAALVTTLLFPEPFSKPVVVVALIGTEVALVLGDVGFDIYYAPEIAKKKAAIECYLRGIDRSEQISLVRQALLERYVID